MQIEQNNREVSHKLNISPFSSFVAQFMLERDMTAKRALVEKKYDILMFLHPKLPVITQAGKLHY